MFSQDLVFIQNGSTQYDSRACTQCLANRNPEFKGIVIDSNNIFLWHESEDIHKKSLFPKVQLIPMSRFQVMHNYVCFIAPIDYCVE